MTKIEKVKKGLDLCLTGGDISVCKDCPYNAECGEALDAGDRSPLQRDALELLEEQDKTIESLTEEKERLLLERIAELQHNIAALHAAMQDTILVNNAIEQKQALKREYMRGYDKAWEEIGRR